MGISLVIFFCNIWVYNIVKEIHGNFYLSIGLIILVGSFAYLFLLFLFKQYGSIASGMANMQAYSFWIRKLLLDESAFDGFNFNPSENGIIPASIENTVTDRYEKIRQYSIYERLLIPLYLFLKLVCKKDKKEDKNKGLERKTKNEDKEHVKDSSTEVQEAILYDMIILSTFFLIIYIILNINFVKLCLEHYHCWVYC